MAEVTQTSTTTTFESKDLGNGNYEINQVEAEEFVPPGQHSGNRKQFSFPLVMGAAVVGYYDIDDKEIGAYATIAGQQVGAKYTAGIDSGLNVSLNIYVMKGSFGVFKSGNKLKARYSFSSIWGGDQSKEFDVLTL